MPIRFKSDPLTNIEQRVQQHGIGDAQGQEQMQVAAHVILAHLGSRSFACNQAMNVTMIKQTHLHAGRARGCPCQPRPESLRQCS